MTRSTSEKQNNTLANKQDVSKFVNPHERALLSLAYLSQKNLSKIATTISSDYFLFPPHKIIFTAMTSLMTEVNRLDFNTLKLKCLELGLDKSVADQYLHLATKDGGFDDSTLDLQLNEVKDSYIKYKLSLTLNEVGSSLEENKEPGSKLNAEDLLEQLNKNIAALYAYRGLEDEAVSFSKRARELVLERAESPSDVRGLRTGFPTLDKQINGLLAGTLTVFTARYKVGKSVVLSNIANYVAYQSKQGSVLFLSTEMSDDEDILRQLSIKTLIPEREISNGTAWHRDRDKELLETALKDMESSPCQVYHQYMPVFTINSVVSTAKYWIQKVDNLRLIIFDYIKLPTSTQDSLFESKEYQILGDFTNALKNDLAGRENIAVVTACQLNQQNCIADSDRIARFANTVIYLRHQTPEEIERGGDFHKHGTRMFDIRTTRSGGRGLVPIRFWSTCLFMEEADSLDEVDGDSEVVELTSPRDMVESINKKYNKPKPGKDVLEEEEPPEAVEVLLGGSASNRDILGEIRSQIDREEDA